MDTVQDGVQVAGRRFKPREVHVVAQVVAKGRGASRPWGVKAMPSAPFVCAAMDLRSSPVSVFHT